MLIGSLVAPEALFLLMYRLNYQQEKEEEEELKYNYHPTKKTVIFDTFKIHLHMSHKCTANLISTDGVAEATALNADDLVVGPLVRRDGVDSGGGAGGGTQGKAA